MHINLFRLKEDECFFCVEEQMPYLRQRLAGRSHWYLALVSTEESEAKT